MIFSKCKNSDNSNPTVFCGWRQLSRVGHGQAESGRQRLARPVVYSNHGSKPDPAARFLLHRQSAKPGSRHSISQGVCPAWPVTSSGHFRVCLRAVAPPPRNVDATTCSLARARRCLWVAARSPQAAYEAESAMPYTDLRIPLVRGGCVVP